MIMKMRYSIGTLKLTYLFFPLACFFLYLQGCNGGSGGGVELGPSTPAEGLNKLNIQITDAVMTSRPVVTFTLTDDMGNPLDPATVNLRFVLARIEKGERQYKSYITRVQTSPITGVSATQADFENSTDGTLENLGGGVIRYIFAFKLPENIDRNATHTVGIFADTTIQGVQFVANDTFDFVPSGGSVTTVRDIVRTETCNSCHDPLKLHGGFRRDVKLCVMCHTTEITDSNTGITTPQIDPDTGNNIGFMVMIHKIHRGAELPSVKAGTPYEIIGFRQGIEDFSPVEFPQDIRNCKKCHTGGIQSENYETEPSRAACGSCHDDVNFATAQNHPIVQLNDNNCSGCHIPDTGKEFDISVEGAHTIPLRSTSLPGVNFEIVSVKSAETGLDRVGPGEHAQVTYNIKTDAGEVINPQDMNVLALTIAGPTSEFNIQDYNGDGLKTPGAENVLRENVAQGSIGPDSSGNFAYTFNGIIPPNATGTYAVGIEGRIERTVGGNNRVLVEEVEEAGRNVVFYFPVTDTAPKPRRLVVSNTIENELCYSCHGEFSKDFSIHGNLRNNTEYCVLCHNPSADDIPFRTVPEGMTDFTTAIDFKNMIHKIHTGEDIANKPYIIVGFFGSINDFSELRFPGDRRDCEACHLPDTNLLVPGMGVLGASVRSTTDREILGVGTGVEVVDTFLTSPVISVCTSCHDDVGVTESGDALTGANHPGGARTEGECVACHGVGAPVSVSDVHFPPLSPADRISRPNN